MDRKDWLLLVLSSGGSLSPVQLQKSLFLIAQELTPSLFNDYYEFVPYDYGPFDSDIYSDAHTLQSEGHVVIDNPLARGWRRYSITDSGQEQAQSIRDQLDTGDVEKLDEVVSWVASQSFASLVRSIYERFPEYKTRSVFNQ